MNIRKEIREAISKKKTSITVDDIKDFLEDEGEDSLWELDPTTKWMIWDGIQVRYEFKTDAELINQMKKIFDKEFESADDITDFFEDSDDDDSDGWSLWNIDLGTKWMTWDGMQVRQTFKNDEELIDYFKDSAKKLKRSRR